MRVVDLGRGLQRLVHVSRAVLVGEYAAQNAPMAGRKRQPLRGDGKKVEPPPRIEQNPIDDLEAVRLNHALHIGIS